jgi:Mn2+/Fe2+ NRAMP family transporter
LGTTIRDASIHGMVDTQDVGRADPGDLTGWRCRVDQAFGYLMGAFVVAVLVQVFLAGVGVFGDHSAKVANASSFDPHRALGTVLGLVAVLLFLIALCARASRATVIGALALALLTLAAQPALANAGDSNKWVGGFHALDGMLILVISVWLAGAAHRREAARRRR